MMGDSTSKQAQAHKPRRQRRKENRREEILQAALVEFTAHGFAATRLDAIAQQAQVSKGTIYLYFASKEDLFGALLRQSFEPHLASIGKVIEVYPDTMETLLRGPVKAFQLALLESDFKQLIHLLITEGHAFPDLTAYYMQEVIEPGLALLRRIISRGVMSGEFRESSLDTFPQIIIAPALVALLWQGMFGQSHSLAVAAMLDTHLEILVEGLKARA